MLKRINLLYLHAVLICLAVSSCASGTVLKTRSIADNKSMAGVFTVILYGTQEYESLNTVAFLDIEGDGYELIPYAPEFNYRVTRNVRDEEAVDKALHFISTQNVNFRNPEIRSILDAGGNTIGYELRPVYRSWVYGWSNVLLVAYRLMEDGKVRVSVRLDPWIERRFLHDSDPRER